jgi:hypothetical protein
MKSFIIFQPWLRIPAPEPKIVNIPNIAERLDFMDEVLDPNPIGEQLEKGRRQFFP